MMMMKVRTQLVLACFLLSIVPLGAIVLYTYQSSRRALETAYSSEAARTTRQMDHRLATIRNDLEQRLSDVSALPLRNLPRGGSGAGDQRQVVDNVLLALGDSANLLDSVELQSLAHQPALPRLPRVPPAPAAPHHAGQPDAAPNPAPSEPVEIPQPPAPPEPADEPETIVIDIPDEAKLPRFTMPDEQRQRIDRLGALGRTMSDPSITSAERDKLSRQMNELQNAINAGMAEQRKTFHDALSTSLRAREKARFALMQKREQERAAALLPNPRSRSDVTIKRRLNPEERAALRAHEKRVSLILGEKLRIPVRDRGAIIANLSAQVKPEAVIRRVLGNPGEDGELTFAADRDNNVYTRTGADRRTLDRLGVTAAIRAGKPLPHLENWIIAMSTDARSGLRVGVARRVADDLQGLRRTAAYNFTAGIALVIIALLGILPVANHITRDVNLVTAGAERIAQGDLQTRVPVRSKNEFGQLATAFNKMAEDLSAHQLTILEQERSRKEQELHQQLLAMEYDRKSIELEEARRFQLSMLPKVVPTHPRFRIAVSTETATEVGGDYYDFHSADDGVLTVTVGDATGHGAKAGTMVTVVKTLFSSYTPALSPSRFLHDSAEKIKRMELGRMAMSLLLARFEGGRMTIAAAGMPPALVHRAATGAIDELVLEATPLGTLGSDYAERSVALASGDTVLLLTDGFPELLDADGRQLGYITALDRFAIAARAATPEDVIASLAGEARAWRGEQAPNDDMTFVVIRVA